MRIARHIAYLLAHLTAPDLYRRRQVGFPGDKRLEPSRRYC